MNNESFDEQTGNRRQDGRFAKGNRLGNRFAPGKSGNERGRPKSALLSDELRRQLADIDDDGKTLAHKVAAALIQKAVSGDVAAAKEIFDRVEGKPTQNIVADVGLTDWRTLATDHGLTEQQILDEAKLLLANSDGE